jgi:hypothetical protein
MTIRRPTNEKNPTVTNTRPRSTALNLIQEALARARMRSPQNGSEARRSARNIAMQARRQQAREMGNLSQFGIR